MKIFKTREDLLNIFETNLVVAELGVFKGEFSKYIFNNLKPKKLYLVDLFIGNVGSGDKDGNNMVYTNLENEFNILKEYFINNDNVVLIKNDTINFLNSIENESLDIIYIDADHEYESVKKDLNYSLPKVKKGGFICGHDYVSPRFHGVVKAVNEFCFENKLKIEYLTEDGCPTYCIIKK